MQDKEELLQGLANSNKSQESKDLQKYVELSKKRLKALLKRLQWTEDGVLSNFNSNSKAVNNPETLGKDIIDPPLPVSCATKNSITIGKRQLQQIVENPVATIPQKFSELQLNFNREQKLRLYEYVVEHTDKYMEPELTVPIHYDGNSMTFAQIVTMKKREKRRKEKLRKYRTSKPTHIEEVRNLVELQMQALEQYINPEEHHRSRSNERNYIDRKNGSRSRKLSPSKSHSRKRSYSRKRSHSRKRNNSRGRSKSTEENCYKRKRSTSTNRHNISRDTAHHSNKRSQSRRRSNLRSRTRSLSKDNNYHASVKTHRVKKRSQSKETFKTKEAYNKEKYSYTNAKYKHYSERNDRSRSRRRDSSRDNNNASPNRSREIREMHYVAYKERDAVKDTKRKRSRDRSYSRNQVHSKEKHSYSRHKTYEKKRSRSPSSNRKDSHRRRQTSDRSTRDESNKRNKTRQNRKSRSRNGKTSHKNRKRRTVRESSSESSSNENTDGSVQRNSHKRSKSSIYQNQTIHAIDIKTEAVSSNHIKSERECLSYNSVSIKVERNDFNCNENLNIKEENLNGGYNGNGIKTEPVNDYLNY